MQIYAIFALSMLLFYIGEKKNNKIFPAIAVLLLSLFVGLRDITVGIDTETYYQMLEKLKSNDFPGSWEIGFVAISFVLIKVFRTPVVLFCIFSLITNALIAARFWQMRKQYSFSLTMLLYLILFYPQSCNIMRQYLAMAIVFFATVFLERKKYIYFLIAVALACSIHISAVAALLLLPLSLLLDVSIEKEKRKKVFLVLLCLLPFAIGIAVWLIFFSKYSAYFLAANNNVGLMNFARIGMLALSALLAIDLFRHPSSQASENEKTVVSLNRIALFSSITAISLYFLGYYNTTMVRVGYYFGLFELPLIVLFVCKTKGKKKLIPIIGYMGILLIYIALNATSGWSGLGSYTSSLNLIR